MKECDMPKMLASRLLVAMLGLSMILSCLSCSGNGDSAGRKMSEAAFWKLIEQSIDASDDTIEGQTSYLEERLTTRSENEIIGFELTLRDMLRQSYHCNVTALLKIIDGWVTDDPLLYFRCRLILYGRDLFYTVIENPNNLTERLDSDMAAEDLLYVADKAFIQKFGDDTDKTLPREAGFAYSNYDGYYPMLGEPWDYSDFAERYAPLLRLYGISPETYDPQANTPYWVSTIDNRYSPLKPGTTFIYEGTKAGRPQSIKVYVTHQTKDFGNFGSIPCIGVSENVSVDGQIVKESFYWYTQTGMGDVWCLSASVKNFENGQMVNTEGSWEGDTPGISMTAVPQVGVGYRKAPEEWVSIVGLNESVTVPYGSFQGCLKTKDTSELGPGIVENTYYAPGVGKVLTVVVEGGSDRSELVSVTTE
jgi:hypothetical protein